MSSYVVSKGEYVKAAGILAGIEAATKTSIWHHLHVWDEENGKVMTGKEFYASFVACYRLNVLSVQEQYHDEEPEKDEHDYMDTFNEFFEKGRKLSRDQITMREFIFVLNDFFRTVLYQVENEDYDAWMRQLFGRITAALLAISDPFASMAYDEKPTIDTIFDRLRTKN